MARRLPNWRTTPAARAATTISARRGRPRSRAGARFHPDNPLVIVGGGYDACEDADISTPACTNPKGSSVYVINADNGALVKSFGSGGTGSIARSVAGDVTLVDRDFDGYVDHGYFADVGGALRIDFVRSHHAGDAPADRWTLTKLAQTTGARQEVLVRASALRPRARLPHDGSGRPRTAARDNYPYVEQVQNRALHVHGQVRDHRAARGPGQYVADGQLYRDHALHPGDERELERLVLRPQFRPRRADR